VQGKLGVSTDAAKLSLNRLARRGTVASPARGFYVIVPPEHRKLGCLTADQFLPAVMEWCYPLTVVDAHSRLPVEQRSVAHRGTAAGADRAGQAATKRPTRAFASHVEGGAARPPAEDRQRQQRCFDRFRREYNQDRPHEDLGQRPPAAAYETPRGPTRNEFPGRDVEARLAKLVCFKRFVGSTASMGIHRAASSVSLVPASLLLRVLGIRMAGWSFSGFGRTSRPLRRITASYSITAIPKSIRLDSKVA
jgi:hypothetical protein